ncbi:hypothetical protein F5X98DRAFT_343527 [Xylaria grammica]|nr:hypothetical protein F5X98DRAFT_343527 [Xylaria grammica]
MMRQNRLDEAITPLRHSVLLTYGAADPFPPTHSPRSHGTVAQYRYIGNILIIILFRLLQCVQHYYTGNSFLGGRGTRSKYLHSIVIAYLGVGTLGKLGLNDLHQRPG